MARIAIDMDGVMADTTQQMIDWYAKRYGVTVDKATLYGIPESSGFPHETAELRKFLFEPGFFRTKAVIKDSQEVIRALQDKYEVFIVSAALEFPPSLPEKVEWLAEHFPFISWQNIVFCGSKTIIQADIMIDDHVKNLQPFTGQGLMFTAPHNINVTDFKRVDSWQDVAGLLL